MRPRASICVRSARLAGAVSLAALGVAAEPSGGPQPGGELLIGAPAPHEWSPFTEPHDEPVDDAGLSGPGHLLPLLYSQLVPAQVDDLTDPHRTHAAGDLASRWEWPDPLTLVFQLEPQAVWPDREPTFGRALTVSDAKVLYDAFREPGRWQPAPMTPSRTPRRTSGPAR